MNKKNKNSKISIALLLVLFASTMTLLFIGSGVSAHPASPAEHAEARPPIEANHYTQNSPLQNTPCKGNVIYDQLLDLSLGAIRTRSIYEGSDIRRIANSIEFNHNSPCGINITNVHEVLGLSPCAAEDFIARHGVVSIEADTIYTLLESSGFCNSEYGTEPPCGPGKISSLTPKACTRLVNEYRNNWGTSPDCSSFPSREVETYLDSGDFTKQTKYLHFGHRGDFIRLGRTTATNYYCSYYLTDFPSPTAKRVNFRTDSNPIGAVPFSSCYKLPEDEIGSCHNTFGDIFGGGIVGLPQRCQTLVNEIKAFPNTQQVSLSETRQEEIREELQDALVAECCSEMTSDINPDDQELCDGVNRDPEDPSVVACREAFEARIGSGSVRTSPRNIVFEYGFRYGLNRKVSILPYKTSYLPPVGGSGRHKHHYRLFHRNVKSGYVVLPEPLPEDCELVCKLLGGREIEENYIRHTYKFIRVEAGTREETVYYKNGGNSGLRGYVHECVWDIESNFACATYSHAHAHNNRVRVSRTFTNGYIKGAGIYPSGQLHGLVGDNSRPDEIPNDKYSANDNFAVWFPRTDIFFPGSTEIYRNPRSCRTDLLPDAPEDDGTEPPTIKRVAKTISIPEDTIYNAGIGHIEDALPPSQFDKAPFPLANLNANDRYEALTTEGNGDRYGYVRITNGGRWETRDIDEWMQNIPRGIPGSRVYHPIDTDIEDTKQPVSSQWNSYSTMDSSHRSQPYVGGSDRSYAICAIEDHRVKSLPDARGAVTVGFADPMTQRNDHLRRTQFDISRSPSFGCRDNSSVKTAHAEDSYWHYNNLGWREYTFIQTDENGNEVETDRCGGVQLSSTGILTNKARALDYERGRSIHIDENGDDERGNGRWTCLLKRTRTPHIFFSREREVRYNDIHRVGQTTRTWQTFGCSRHNTVTIPRPNPDAPEGDGNRSRTERYCAGASTTTHTDTKVDGSSWTQTRWDVQTSDLHIQTETQYLKIDTRITNSAPVWCRNGIVAALIPHTIAGGTSLTDSPAYINPAPNQVLSQQPNHCPSAHRNPDCPNEYCSPAGNPGFDFPQRQEDQRQGECSGTDTTPCSSPVRGSSQFSSRQQKQNLWFAVDDTYTSPLSYYARETSYNLPLELKRSSFAGAIKGISARGDWDIGSRYGTDADNLRFARTIKSEFSQDGNQPGSEARISNLEKAADIYATDGTGDSDSLPFYVGHIECSVDARTGWTYIPSAFTYDPGNTKTFKVFGGDEVSPIENVILDERGHLTNHVVFGIKYELPNGDAGVGATDNSRVTSAGRDKYWSIPPSDQIDIGEFCTPAYPSRVSGLGIGFVDGKVAEDRYETSVTGTRDGSLFELYAQPKTPAIVPLIPSYDAAIGSLTNTVKVPPFLTGTTDSCSSSTDCFYPLSFYTDRDTINPQHRANAEETCSTEGTFCFAINTEEAKKIQQSVLPKRQEVAIDETFFCNYAVSTTYHILASPTIKLTGWGNAFASSTDTPAYSDDKSATCMQRIYKDKDCEEDCAKLDCVDVHRNEREERCLTRASSDANAIFIKLLKFSTSGG